MVGDITVLLKAFVGVLAALLWGALGYAVARRKGEDFDPENFGVTVLIGFILGLLALIAGADVTTLENYTILQLITILVDKLYGLIKKPKSVKV